MQSRPASVQTGSVFALVEVNRATKQKKKKKQEEKEIARD